MKMNKILFIIAIVLVFLCQPIIAAQAAELNATDVDAIKKHEGEFATVVGDIHSTYKAPSGKVRFLNFGPDYRTAFTVVIFTSDLSKFMSDVGEPTTYYKGKRVKVEGRIKMYKGKPEIIANSPDQIVILK